MKNATTHWDQVKVLRKMWENKFLKGSVSTQPKESGCCKEDFLQHGESLCAEDRTQMTYLTAEPHIPFLIQLTVYSMLSKAQKIRFLLPDMTGREVGTVHEHMEGNNKQRLGTTDS